MERAGTFLGIRADNELHRAYYELYRADYELYRADYELYRADNGKQYSHNHP